MLVSLSITEPVVLKVQTKKSHLQLRSVGTLPNESATHH